MWYLGMTCKHCNTVIARGEAKDHVGNFWFHVDETKNCLTKYLRARHEAMEAELAKKVPAGRTVRQPIWKFHRGEYR